MLKKISDSATDSVEQNQTAYYAHADLTLHSPGKKNAWLPTGGNDRLSKFSRDKVERALSKFSEFSVH